MNHEGNATVEQNGKLKVVILTGGDSTSLRLSISTLASLSEVKILAVLLDSEPQSLKTRLRNLRRNVRREGFSYIPFRLHEFLKNFLDHLAAGIIPHQEVVKLLRQSFPEQAFCLTDLSRQYGLPILKVGNLNGPVAADTLRHLNADLGIVMGTRILKRSTFSIPRMGCLNVHMGKVPEYRGLPPGFWELYEGQASAGVTIHFVDDGLDTGEIVGEDCVPIHPRDSVVTLQSKLGMLASSLLARCVHDLAQSRAMRRPQRSTHRKPRTSPTRRQQDELDEKLGLSSKLPSRLLYTCKTLLYSVIYYSGLFHLVRTVRKITVSYRVCVLLYHRVNDLADDAMTAGVQQFAEHMAVIRKYYSVLPTSVLVQKLKSGEKLPGNSLVIHFDDCYRDVYTHASAILAQVEFPACCFVSSGFIGTDKAFPHDLAMCPFQMENLMPNDIIGLIKRGFEIGSHSVTHADLGHCSHQEAFTEVFQSKKDLDSLLGKPVRWFSYPFGGRKNIRPEVVELVRQAGYEAMFSAYGGYVTSKSDSFNLHRVGASGQFRPLDILMEIEGLSLGSLKRWWKYCCYRDSQIKTHGAGQG